ncbi:CobW family GTP-binding protein [Brevibacterium jeotgali]|uniref:Cobalamin synthesis protein cobW C-terminal domain-containing protein n=1 Tax=Brevibacterium jeotgali TaxID=1262550 RepID=A0A2H1L3A2_9MICO|nr:CobW family GTP-binding protein [Brevibacterium jeotgali]TWC01631.1 cobalamin synthesis protein cobW-like protein [Brevibacterium jeotgali]SMY11376.1 Cobalamin synthesis protein cobW C-terminal domain-containing protein [Brevibacterium jeotgali]
MSRTSWNPAVPVILLTGYLGAGKTSILNHLLRHPGSRVGVVVNDFGDLNVDAGLVAGQVDEPVSIAGGCVCCLSDTSALEGALASLADPRLELDAIIVEASGIAEPLTLARMVSQWGRHRFHLAGVVDIVDALMHEETVDTGSMPPMRYAATTLVVVNKLDLLPVDEREAAVEAIRRRVHQRNPRVLVTGTVFGRLDPALIVDAGAVHGRAGPDRSAVSDGGAAPDGGSVPGGSGVPDGGSVLEGSADEPIGVTEVQGELPVWDLLRQEYSEREAAALAGIDQRGVPHRHARSVTVRLEGCADPAGVLDFVEDPPPGVYRVKGTIAVADGKAIRRFIVQAVGPSVYVSAAPERAASARDHSAHRAHDDHGSHDTHDRQVTSSLVAIGEDFDEDAVHATLHAVMTPASGPAGARGSAGEAAGPDGDVGSARSGASGLGGGVRIPTGLDRLDRYVRLHS